MSFPSDESRIERINRDLARSQRSKSPAEKIELISQANSWVRRLVCEDVRNEHRDWPEEQSACEVAWRMLEANLMARADFDRLWNRTAQH